MTVAICYGQTSVYWDRVYLREIRIHHMLILYRNLRINWKHICQKTLTGTNILELYHMRNMHDKKGGET